MINKILSILVIYLLYNKIETTFLPNTGIECKFFKN